MMREFEENPKALLESKLLGRSLYELVNDGMNSKLLHMPDESRAKMGQTIEKIINEGAAGLICIII
jgi:stage IV sporulation protein A